MSETNEKQTSQADDQVDQVNEEPTPSQEEMQSQLIEEMKILQPHDVTNDHREYVYAMARDQIQKNGARMSQEAEFRAVKAIHAAINNLPEEHVAVILRFCWDEYTANMINKINLLLLKKAPVDGGTKKGE